MTRGDRTPVSAARPDLGLLQPEPHVHLAAHGGRRRDVLLRLLESPRAPVELAEAQMAVGDKGPHAALLGERQRVAEMTTLSFLRGIAAGGAFAYLLPGQLETMYVDAEQAWIQGALTSALEAALAVLQA
jgi:hypothetical protein